MDSENKVWDLGENTAKFPIKGLSLNAEQLKIYFNSWLPNEENENANELIDKIKPLIESLNQELKNKDFKVLFKIL